MGSILSCYTRALVHRVWQWAPYYPVIQGHWFIGCGNGSILSCYTRALVHRVWQWAPYYPVIQGHWFIGCGNGLHIILLYKGIGS